MTREERHQELLKQSQAALARAGRAAIQRGKETGTPVWAWRDGRWVDVLAEPDESTSASAPASEAGSPSLARVREEPED